jgi:hypothetical protein
LAMRAKASRRAVTSIAALTTSTGSEEERSW